MKTVRCGECISYFGTLFSCWKLFGHRIMQRGVVHKSEQSLDKVGFFYWERQDCLDVYDGWLLVRVFIFTVCGHQ